MWFEILPSFAIIVGCMALPHAGSYVINKLVVGNHFRRSCSDRSLAHQYMRDQRLTGSPYKIQGLEAIPDA